MPGRVGFNQKRSIRAFGGLAFGGALEAEGRFTEMKVSICGAVCGLRVVRLAPLPWPCPLNKPRSC
jgi:hypothetical protein